MHKPQFLEKDLFTIPLPILARPSVIIGEGGSGKTESALKIAHLAAKAYNMDVIYIDAKGDNDLIPRFVAAMHDAGKQRIQVFPTTPYNGWRGDPRALHNRLMAVQIYSEAYYENMANLLLDLAVYAPDATPRSSTQLLKNLTLEQLKLCYRGREEQAELSRIRPEDANGVYNRYRAFFRALHGKLDTGFTFDEADAAYIKLDTVAFAKEAGSIGRYLIEDLAHYMAERKLPNKRVLIIIDEVSALAIENIANLSERLRSFGGALMLACQSEEGLAKTQDERNRILKTSHMLILHTCNAPEKLTQRAGSRKEVVARWSMRGEEGTNHATVSMEDRFMIPPDEARRLNVGECFVIAQGYAYKVHVAPVQIAPASLADAQTYLEQQAARTVVVEMPTQSQSPEVPTPTVVDADQDANEGPSGTTSPDLL